MSGLNNGNKRQAHDCPYCILTMYSKGALTRHINNEHWKQVEDEEKLLNSLPAVVAKAGVNEPA